MAYLMGSGYRSFWTHSKPEVSEVCCRPYPWRSPEALTALLAQEYSECEVLFESSNNYVVLVFSKVEVLPQMGCSRIWAGYTLLFPTLTKIFDVYPNIKNTNTVCILISIVIIMSNSIDYNPDPISKSIKFVGTHYISYKIIVSQLNM